MPPRRFLPCVLALVLFALSACEDAPPAPAQPAELRGEARLDLGARVVAAEPDALVRPPRIDVAALGEGETLQGLAQALADALRTLPGVARVRVLRIDVEGPSDAEAPDLVVRLRDLGSSFRDDGRLRGSLAVEVAAGASLTTSLDATPAPGAPAQVRLSLLGRLIGEDLLVEGGASVGERRGVLTRRCAEPAAIAIRDLLEDAWSSGASAVADWPAPLRPAPEAAPLPAPLAERQARRWSSGPALMTAHESTWTWRARRPWKDEMLDLMSGFQKLGWSIHDRVAETAERCRMGLVAGPLHLEVELVGAGEPGGDAGAVGALWAARFRRFPSPEQRANALLELFDAETPLPLLASLRRHADATTRPALEAALAAKAAAGALGAAALLTLADLRRAGGDAEGAIEALRSAETLALAEAPDAEVRRRIEALRSALAAEPAPAWTEERLRSAGFRVIRDRAEIGEIPVLEGEPLPFATATPEGFVATVFRIRRSPPGELFDLERRDRRPDGTAVEARVAGVDLDAAGAAGADLPAGLARPLDRLSVRRGAEGALSVGAR